MIILTLKERQLIDEAVLRFGDDKERPLLYLLEDLADVGGGNAQRHDDEAADDEEDESGVEQKDGIGEHDWIPDGSGMTLLPPQALQGHLSSVCLANSTVA